MKRPPFPTQSDQLAKDILLGSFLERRGSCFLEKLEEERHSSGRHGGEHGSPMLGLSSLVSPPPPFVLQLTQGQVGDHAGEDKGRQEGEGENKRIKEPVIPSPHTVAHPRAVMVKPL